MINLDQKIVALSFARLALCVGLVFGALATEAAASDTLSIWVMDNGLGSKNAMKRLVKKFYRETGIPVKLTSLSWGEAFRKITFTFADSNDVAPDVIQLGSTWVPHFAAAGAIRPIDSLISKIDTSRFLGEGLRSTHISGKPETYAVPWFIDVRGFFVNERIWQQLGFDDSDFEYGSDDGVNFHHRLRLGYTTQVFPFFGLSVGGTLNLAAQGYGEKILVKPLSEYHDDFGHEGDKFRFWPGFYAGITVGRF